MKSQQRRTLVKKPKPSNMAVKNPKDNTLGGYSNWGAGQPVTDITGMSGIDTITLDPSIYSINTSITAPSTITWNQDYANNWGSTDTMVKIDTNGINIKEGGDIKLGDKSLSEAIEKIEERLGILRPNPELEDRWEQLKELRKQYMELEKDLLEKEKIMKILKEK